MPIIRLCMSVAEVTDLTLTFSDLQNVNGHCANVKSASCDPKQSISVSGQSAFISMWSNLQVSANLAGGCSLYDVITLWPDMTLTIFFTKSCAKDAPEGTENFSKLSQKVRRVAKKNLRGGCTNPLPPLHGRGLRWDSRFNPRQWRGGLMQPPPHEFFWAARQTVWSIMLKFSIAYGASFAQLLVKKKLVRSGQVTKLWRHKGNNLRQDFSEIVSKRNLAWCDWLEWDSWCD